MLQGVPETMTLLLLVICFNAMSFSLYRISYILSHEPQNLTMSTNTEFAVGTTMEATRCAYWRRTARPACIHLQSPP